MKHCLKAIQNYKIQQSSLFLSLFFKLLFAFFWSQFSFFLLLLHRHQINLFATALTYSFFSLFKDFLVQLNNRNGLRKKTSTCSPAVLPSLSETWNRFSTFLPKESCKISAFTRFAWNFGDTVPSFKFDPPKARFSLSLFYFF